MVRIITPRGGDAPIFALAACLTFYHLVFAAAAIIPRACVSPHDEYPFCDVGLSVNERVDDLISRLTLDEKPYLLVAREAPLGNISRLGIPAYDWGGNCVHGVNSRCTKDGICPTSYPNPIGLASTFNRSVWHDMGNTIGVELRALWLLGVGENHESNLPHIGLDCWSPNINICRDPRWGRNLETPGEDPLVNGEFAVHVTRGLQYNSMDPRYLQAVVTLKHFVANSLEGNWGRNGSVTRHSVDAQISDYDLASTYLAAFRRSVMQGGAKGIMCSYNSVNGVPVCASKYLLNDTLRESWGFQGYVTSDSGALQDFLKYHHYTSTWNETVAAALNAGCDMESAEWSGSHAWGTGGLYIDYIASAVRAGLVDESRVDEALRHVLTLLFQLGLFDPIDDQPYWHVPKSAIRSEAHLNRALDATSQSLVLLQNDDHLGLPFVTGNRVLVVGPHALDRSAILGNYIGEICPDASFDCVDNPFEAISKLNDLDGGQTVAVTGVDVNSTCTAHMQQAIDAAKKADYIVYIGGLGGSIEAEAHDRPDIGLPGVQPVLLRSLLDLQKPTAVVLYHGGIVQLEASLLSDVPALVSSGYPGFFGAQAIAAALFDTGDTLATNRFGKTTMSWYGQAGWEAADFDMVNFHMADAPGRTYRYYSVDDDDLAPDFPFGHGLGYARTRFHVSARNRSAQVLLDVEVSNLDKKRSTDEVVLLFASAENDVIPDNEPASKLVKTLIGFERVGPIGPGETSPAVSFRIDPKVLSLHRNDGTEAFFPGNYNIAVGTGDAPIATIKCPDETECHVASNFKLSPHSTTAAPRGSLW